MASEETGETGSSPVARTVLLLGAGASVSQAASYRPKRSLEHPPLDANFFRKTLALAKRHPDVGASVSSLRIATQGSARFGNPFEGSGPSLEQFFADVYYEVASMRSASAFKVFLELLHLYVRTLSATTNWFATSSRVGSLGKLLRKESSRCGQLTVITFNHDLVIENAVARMPRVSTGWCLTSLYDEPDFDLLYARENVPKFPHCTEDKCPHSPPLKLLKLHGSLNWGVRSLSKEPKLGTLFPGPTRKIFLLDRRLMSDPQKMLSGTKKGRSTWYLWPLVVPPIYDKHRVTGMGILERQWQAADRAIGKTHRLILIGYSLPDADVVATQMLRRAFLENRNLDVVDCINPDATLAGKLKERLSCPVVRLFHDVENYLEHG